MPKFSNGTVFQSGLSLNPDDYSHQSLNYPCLGIILSVYYSDDLRNPTAIPSPSGRGSTLCARVLLVNTGKDDFTILPKVIVTPNGISGYDDFSEETPRGCSKLIDGSNYITNLQDVDINKLDGDWCVVGFIGGSINQPFIMRWWPHPSNTWDPSTSGVDNSANLVQGPRSVKRFKGNKFTITNIGDVFVDTSEANATLSDLGVTNQGNPDLFRILNPPGGNFYVFIKNNAEFKINFNEPVNQPTKYPSLLQTNPPQGDGELSTNYTSLTLDRDTANLITQLTTRIQSLEKDVEFLAKQFIYLQGKNINMLAEENLITASKKTTIGATETVSIGEGALDPLQNGVVLGGGIDTFTGLPYSLLGNASSSVLAKK